MWQEPTNQLHPFLSQDGETADHSYRDSLFKINLVAELLQAIFSAGNPFILCWNFRVFMESAGHGCLATVDATGTQATEHFGKKEKAARLAFSTRF